MSATNFDDLLQDAEQMSAQIDKENSGMPRLQRTLSQLVEFNKRKLAKTGAYVPSDSNEINASILLAARGIDAPKLTQTIESLVPPQPSLSASMTTQPSGSVPSGAVGQDFSPFERFANMDYLRDVDLASFLKSEREQALMQIVNETRERQSADVDEAFEQAGEIEWEKQKQKIMNELLGSFGSSSSLGVDLNTSLSSMTSTTLNVNRQPTMTRTLMSDVELEFAKQVFIYNQKIIEGSNNTNEQSKPDLLLTLRSLVQKLQDKNIEDVWEMAYFMTGDESNVPPRTPPYDETELAIDRAHTPQMQSFFISQAVAYLERCFRELVHSKVSTNLKQARLGGQLGTLALVSAYLRLSVSEKYHLWSYEKYEGDAGGYDQQPLWPTIYLCLRCGDIEAARVVALKAKKDDIAMYLDEILKDWTASRRTTLGHLSSSSENKLKIEYKSRIRRDQDIYKRAVYCYLCRYSGDDESIKEVLDNVDDFLWFKLNSIVVGGAENNSKLSLVRESSSTSVVNETLSFVEFQNKMSIEFGEKYFVKNRNPFTYLEVLLLTAQFELAIEFMLKFETLLVHAVHLALCLFERGLLNVLKSPINSQLILPVSDSSTSDAAKCWRRVNLPSLIKMYTRKFECTDPREALQYYYFLRTLRIPSSEDTAAQQQQQQQQLDLSTRIDNFFARFVCELALETREFDLLFGRLEKNTVRRPGVVDKFASNEREVDAIIGLVANEMDQRGLVEEAIKLFDLSKQHKRVFELCNKLLNQIVTEINVPNSNRDRLKSMIMSIALRYKSETNMSTRAIPTSVVYTFYLLTDLMQFFDLYHEENWEIAYETLGKLAILPSTSLQVDAKVKDFIGFSEEIKRNFPELLLAAMTIISNLYAKLNKTSINSPSYQNIGSLLLGGNNEKKMILNQLKENAKALIKFVGCIPYRLSGDINARLLQLEVMMN